ncbi:MAG: hypothetical protein HFH56_06185 [Lachnospiraceae bacterium]|nr:hypothetical protein [Lachnospiraceae bacterium]
MAGVTMTIVQKQIHTTRRTQMSRHGQRGATGRHSRRTGAGAAYLTP